MRKLILLLLCLSLLLTACGTGIQELPEELLSINGKTVLTRTDLLFAAEYEAEPIAEELFLKLAEQAICAFLAEQEEVSEDPAAIRAEYEIYLENLSASGQQDAHDALRECFPELSDKAFDELFQQYLYRSASASAMLKVIAGAYGNIADPETIREGIVLSLSELSSHHDIVISYPELEDHFFLFEYVS